MLDRFMCQPGHAEMLNLAPACQDMAVLDIGMAQVKPRRLEDLQGGDRGIAHAALLGKKRGRCPEHCRKRAEAPHQRLGKRLGVAAPVARIEKHFQQFKLAESLASIVQQLGTHAAPMPGHVVGRAVGVRGIGRGGHHAQWDSPKGLKKLLIKRLGNQA